MNKMIEERFVLPADIYDALEFVAVAQGGIGGGFYGSGPNPICIYGCANFLDTGDAQCREGAGVRDAIKEARISADANDRAVARINQARKRAKEQRVPFAALCKEMHIVRGDS
jgi:hypothetical protein